MYLIRSVTLLLLSVLTVSGLGLVLRLEIQTIRLSDFVNKPFLTF